MMRRGIAELPLHGGHVPRWLALRMKRLANIMIKLLIDEYGTQGVLERLADPIWFQALNNLIGMDWDSSGSTTVTAGILKEILSKEELGIKAAGGKGAKSRNTPHELEQISKVYDLNPNEYIRTSKLVAKVDSVALQNGYQLYHHVFFVDQEGRWAIVQQGMNPQVKLARRYHWFSEKIKSFTLEPHNGISGIQSNYALNTIAKEAKEYQKTLLDIISENPTKIEREIKSVEALTKGYAPLFYKPYEKRKVVPLFERYQSFGKLELNKRALELARELSVDNYDELLLIKGLGPSTLRALSLVLELIYDVHPSWKDPVTHPPDPFKFAYAVGGKDRVPFPIERGTYDELISFLEKLLDKGKNDREVVKQVTKISRKWKFPEKEKRPT
ncbi:DUF763 domain-containing protein [Thermococcus argininiproducens]|uniref:DUF763 domain-containing protein n=1 Tax=Thermococcus argininiproducens TaxID=2866384 RepID=UPI0020748058|nr:DUF763 domain-containing protein [Thermococcus argininiproducens]